MTYQNLLKRIAAQNNTTPQEVDKQMRYVIHSAGYDMPPEAFISLVAAKVKKQADRH